MNKETRITIASILVLAIVGVCIIAYMNKDTLFTNNVELEYPDGCIEEYVDTILVTDVCEEGRRIMEEQENNVQDFVLVPPII